MHILYVEDNPFDADLTLRTLARRAPGITLDLAGSVREAIAKLGTASYDLALVDVNLPDGDGMAVLAHLRAAELPMAAVILTGLDDDEAAVAALKIGADDYVVKRDDYLERLPLILQDVLTRSHSRMLRKAQPMPVLALGFDPAEQEQLLRKFGRYAPHIAVEFARTRAELIERLNAVGHSAEVEAVLLADRGATLAGLDTLKLLRQWHRLEVPVLVVADQGSADLALQAIDLGATDYSVRTPGYLERMPAAIESCVQQARLSRLVGELRSTQVELEAAYDSTLEGWARALELRDHETEGHSRRVTTLSVLMAAAHGIAETEIIHIRRGALLHDIGKMGVPDAVLLKPGPLTPEEWRLMRLHPQLAYSMLEPIHFLRPALDIPYCHHERWDGTGYPRGLAGSEIPLAARIFAVADVWDAITNDRPYRKAMSIADALQIIRGGTGSHFDPRVVELFFELELWNANGSS